MTGYSISRRAFLQHSALAGAFLAFPWRRGDDDHERLIQWCATLEAERLLARDVPMGRIAVRVGELAAGSPYVAGTLDDYIKAGQPRCEPLILSLSRFDCVTLVEACLAVGRAASSGDTMWEAFARETERMRYRDGQRSDYGSRLHYFSEWISDGARRGLVRDLGEELGGRADTRPLRFMTEHRGSYPALAYDDIFSEIAAIERRLDDRPRWVIPTESLARIVPQLETGDVLAFATSIAGLDVTHTALAYRDRAGTMRVLHAPLSGGVVEVTRSTLPEYVRAIRRCTGILVARPNRALA